MNEVLKAVKERRSVRAYKQEKVPQDIIESIIEAGNDAPSGMNSQPWRFVVVQDEGLHREMTETCTPNAKVILEPVKESDPERYGLIMKRYEELQDPIYYSAPVIVFVIGQGRYADLSCPLACENMMLAAHALGLGSCWVAFGSLISDNEEIIKALDLEDDERIFGPIVIGYPEGVTGPPEKRPPMVKWL